MTSADHQMTPSWTERSDIYEVSQTGNDASGSSHGANNNAPGNNAFGAVPGSALSRLLSFRAQNTSHVSKRKDAPKGYTSSTKRHRDGDLTSPSFDDRLADQSSSQSLESATIAVASRQHVPSSFGSPASATSKNALKPLIKDILPRSQPGLFPDVVSDTLMARNPNLMGGQDIKSVKAKVRIALKELLDAEEVERVPDTGPSGGSSHRYTRPIMTDNGQSGHSPYPEPPGSQQPVGLPVNSRTPVSPLMATAQLDKTASLWRILHHETPSTASRETESPRTDNETAMQAVQGHTRDSTQTEARVDGHHASEATEGSITGARSEGHDADSEDMLMQLGKKVRRMQRLKAEFVENAKAATENKAQQQKDRDDIIALQCQKQEEETKVAELDAEVRKLQQQLSSMRERAAEHADNVGRLDAEVKGKEEGCARRDVLVHEVAENASVLERELIQLKRELDID